MTQRWQEELDQRTALLARAVRGDVVQRDEWERHPVATIEADAYHHGVTALLADRCRVDPEIPAGLRSVIEAHARGALVRDLEREAELRLAINALGRRTVRALCLKGAHLAYSHYGRPDLRPRVDTDLLVGRDDRSVADAVLVELGYERRSQVTGDLVTSQQTYVRTRDGRGVHTIDLHWRIANPQVVAEMLSHDELWHAAVPLPRLSPWARGLSPVHALLLACVHRVAHHGDSDHLIWLFDITLLMKEFSAADWQWFEDLARERRVAAICGRSLSRAVQTFGGPVPQGLLARFAAEGTAGAEQSAAYLQPRTRVAALLVDVRHLRGWRARGRLLREHLVPPAEYMRARYGPGDRRPLLVLYLRRVLQGARKWF